MAKLKQNRTKEKGVLSFSLNGTLYGGEDPPVLDTILEAVSGGEEEISSVVINLEKLKWISATGLGLLVSLRSRLTKQDIVVKLEKPSDRVRGVLDVTRLSMIFEIIQ